MADMALETPPRRALGDIAVPVAFALARRLRKAPRAIAQELAAALGPIDGVARVEAAPNGYLNFFLDRAHWLRRWTSGRDPSGSVEPSGDKTIVEHTAINPNKAAHIGHLRNAALGDAFGRLLRFQGRTRRDSELHRRHRRPGRRRRRRVPRARAQDARRGARDRRVDAVRLLLLGSLRPGHRVVRATDKARLKIRTAALHAIEHGGNETAEMAAFIAERIVRCSSEDDARE